MSAPRSDFARRYPTYMLPEVAQELLALSRARRLAYRNARSAALFAEMGFAESSLSCLAAAERFTADAAAIRARLERIVA